MENSKTSGFRRTHYCGSLRALDAGKTVSVAGWVQRARNLGKLIFVTLRDREGLVQIIFAEENNKELFEEASALRSEWVVGVTGTVRERGNDKNPDMPTGDIEIVAESICVFTKADTPPFEIVDNTEANDLLRLKYRYLDLRRPSLLGKFKTRNRALQVTRRYFDGEGFYEVETPILTKSSPEGARDYLVPSRVHPGKFFALPQAPQQYKQLLMLAGFDKYIQIARCFRDEDLRADRQPEFTQVDLEMSFVSIDDIFAVGEGYLKTLWKAVLGVDVKTPFRRMTYKEAMENYGSDKPDLRFGFELKNITDIAKDCGFGVFSSCARTGGVYLINLEGRAAGFTRKEIDSLTDFVKGYRASGLAWAKLAGAETTPSFFKFLTDDERAAIIERAGAKDGDLILVVADKNRELALKALGALRLECAKRLKVINEKEFNFLWITEFPLFAWSEEEERIVSEHNPFTSPMEEDIPLLDTDPLKVRSNAYDLVINGYECASGAARIYDPVMQAKVFTLLGISDEEAQKRFGYFLEAYRYGAPPHAGMAFGFDRLVMLLCGTTDIRDVVAFPKLQNASDPMMQGPVEADEKQLSELHIRTVVEKK